MIEALHGYTGTPISNSTRTRDEQSLFGEHKREDLNQRRRKFADDMAHAAVLAEKLEFCDTFFPQPTDPADLERKPKLKENPFASLAKADKLLEAVVRARFTKAINENNLVPGLKLCECGERPDPSTLDLDRQKVDAAFFHTKDAPTDGRQRWPDQVIPVEFKRDDTSLDPWDDGKENINTEANSRKLVRGQCISYSELLYAIQHRIALFMLVIIGTKARFVRWDRSGTVVTRVFDYVKDWEFFCDILWRISLCTDTQLGLDPTATRLRPGDADYDRMTAAAQPHPTDVDEKERDLKPGELPPDRRFVFKYIRTMFSESVDTPWPRYRVEVPEVKEDEDGNEVTSTRHFLIAKPTFRARGMSGRGTRGYVALDCKTGDFVWLKDAWRAHYLLVDKEGDVLKRLNKANVKHIPTLICHGDIQNQVTLTPDWWEAKNPPSSSKAQCAPSTSPAPSSPTPHTCTASSSSASRKRKYDDESRSEDADCTAGFSQFRADCPLRLHKHYRLVEKEIALPLTNFVDGQQLTAIVLDCICAHFHAYTKPKNPVLHRDISGGNILILPRIIEDETGSEIKWSGLLTDWEMSKPKDWKGQGRQPERTGTWQFLSVALLSGRKEVELRDELEAFFYVLLYYGVRYLRSNIDDSAVGTWISTFFDTYGVHNDTYICGNEKVSAIRNGSITIAATSSNCLEFNSPLDHVLETLLRWFKANYIVTQYERERERKNLLPAPEILLAQLADSQSSDSDAPRQRRLDEHIAELDFDSDSDSEGEDEDKGHSGDAPRQTFSRNVIQPSEDDYKSHKRLLEHKSMMKLLTRSIASKPKGLERWKKDDKVGDRVAQDYRPPVQPAGPTLPASFASNKRRKVDGPQFPMSLPNLAAAQWPPKTPERKKPLVPPFITNYMKHKQH